MAAALTGAQTWQPQPGRKYRVVQWATGNVGACALRRAIEHPDLEVVGVYVHSAAKIGLDAGELSGTAPIGIAATSSMADVIALKPDCVPSYVIRGLERLHIELTPN
jgi:4-hydroxy-tetrahydrodipicolinate reductase